MKDIALMGIVVITVFLYPAAALAENAALIRLEERIILEMEAVIDATGQVSEEKLEEYEKLIKQGIQEHDKGKFDKAIELYYKALEKNPLSGLVYYEIGYSHYEQGDMQKSLEAMLRAIALDPKQEMAYVMKASILDDLGMPEEAEKAYRRIIELKPDSFMAVLNLGITLYRENDLDRAIAEFNRANEIVPEHPSPFFFLALAAAQKGETYEEERYLKEFVRVGENDRRLPDVEKRLKELTTTNISINISDMEDAFSSANMIIQMAEGSARALWRTEKHRQAYPDAKGYFPSFEEELDVLETVLSMWKSQKAEDDSLSDPTFDFAAAAEESGYLNEYVWYANRRKLGEKAEAWLTENETRVNAFLAWAESAGFSGQVKDKDPAGESGPDESLGIENLPAIVLAAADESELVYEIGGDFDTGDIEKFRKSEGKRFKSALKRDGNQCVDKKDALEALENLENEIVPMAYRKVIRVFYPGDEEWEAVVKGCMNVGRRYLDHVPPSSFSGVIEKKGNRVLVQMEDPAWIIYFMAKALWRYEPGFRQELGGPDDDKPSVDEEEFAVATLIGGYLNSRNQDSEEDKGPPDPYMDSLVEIFEGQALTGYVLMEILHKTYGVSLECLPEEYVNELEYYMYNFVMEKIESE